MLSIYEYEFEVFKELYKINFYLKKIIYYIFEIYNLRFLG